MARVLVVVGNTPPFEGRKELGARRTLVPSRWPLHGRRPRKHECAATMMHFSYRYVRVLSSRNSYRTGTLVLPTSMYMYKT